MKMCPKNSLKMKSVLLILKGEYCKMKKNDLMICLSSENVQNVYFVVLLQGRSFSKLANYYISYNLLHAIAGKNTPVLKINLMITHIW